MGARNTPQLPWTPLTAACRAARPELVEALLRRGGADPNAADHAGRRPLVVAVVSAVATLADHDQLGLLPPAELGGGGGGGGERDDGALVAAGKRQHQRAAAQRVVRLLLDAGARPALKSTHPPVVGRATASCAGTPAPVMVSAIEALFKCRQVAWRDAGFDAHRGGDDHGCDDRFWAAGVPVLLLLLRHGGNCRPGTGVPPEPAAASLLRDASPPHAEAAHAPEELYQLACAEGDLETVRRILVYTCFVI